jgi:hypothetical protein
MTTMTPEPGFVTGGVDTHLDIHVAAAVDHLGGLLGTASFPTTASGYRETAGCVSKRRRSRRGCPRQAVASVA